jgi:4-hydroxyphenylpyruvate dioxygenase-like putative hemolysin
MPSTTVLRKGSRARTDPVPAPWRFASPTPRLAYNRALELGAKPGPVTAGPMELNIPCIEGIGGSLIYLVDRYGDRTIYDVDFMPVAGEPASRPVGSSASIISPTTSGAAI